MLVTGMGVFKKPRQRGLHGGEDRVRPCLPVLAWCHVCVHTCTHTPHIHHTLPHPHTSPTQSGLWTHVGRKDGRGPAGSPGLPEVSLRCCT